MQQIVDKMVYSLSAPTNKNVVWIKPTGNNTIEMRIYDNNTWVPLSSSGSGGSGSGIDIVDSVDKLDPIAELGSIASVAVQGNLVESSIRDLYQPDASMLDPNAGILTQPELLSSVSSLKVFAPTDITNIGFELVESSFYFVPRDFSMPNALLAMIQVSNSGVFAMAAEDGTGTQQLFVLVEYAYDTNSFIVHDDQVEAFNAILANGKDWCYFGSPDAYFVITEEQFNTLDLFVNAVAGMPTITDVYVKVDKWEKLCEADFNILKQRLDFVTSQTNSIYNEIDLIYSNVDYRMNSKSDVVEVRQISYYDRRMLPNHYYTDTINTTGSITYTLVGPNNTKTYSEYTIQLTCNATPSSILFKYENNSDLTIKWANDSAPSFETGCAYIISIVDRYGVFATYLNS